jgi:hypothetical protein
MAGKPRANNFFRSIKMKKYALSIALTGSPSGKRASSTFTIKRQGTILSFGTFAS